MSRELLKGKAAVVTIGVEGFGDSIRAAGSESIHVDWKPPAQGNPELYSILLALEDRHDEIEEANSLAVRRLMEAQPVWIDVGPALEMIPGFTEDAILHAGPPVPWEGMCGPMKGAVAGALIFEGKASSLEEAFHLAASGAPKFSPCHSLKAVGPMSGVISASMPVLVVENRTAGNRSYSTFNNEKNRKALSFGAYDQDVQNHLAWQRDVMAPMLRETIRRAGGIDLKSIMARALQMGDECHNRHVASTGILLREMLPTLARLGLPGDRLGDLAELILHNDWFFLNFSMAACKAAADAAHGVPMSTMVTAMARNGVESGIRVSGLGDRWSTAPAATVKGIMFPPFTEDDANPDMGDSTITETCGVGAFAMAAAPAMVKLVGGTVADAIGFTRSMAHITLATNKNFGIPYLDFEGTPTGIDIRKVVDLGIMPKINTGIAHRKPGFGIAGAGIAEIPRECFTGALKAYYKNITSSP
jgi:hypothetical protein